MDQDLHESTKKIKKAPQAEKVRQRRLALWLGPSNPGLYRTPTPGTKKAW